MIRFVDAAATGDAWELHAQVDGEWKTINAGTPDSLVGGRFPKGSTAYRVLNVWHNGRTELADPQPLDAKHLGPARRRFSPPEKRWLLEHGVDERVAQTFPRGFSLAEIRDALN
jgi:hypothetical protein